MHKYEIETKGGGYYFFSNASDALKQNVTHHNDAFLSLMIDTLIG